MSTESISSLNRGSSSSLRHQRHLPFLVTLGALPAEASPPFSPLIATRSGAHADALNLADRALL